jgi:hypothetical protein
MIVFGGSYLKIGNDGSFTFGFAHDLSFACHEVPAKTRHGRFNCSRKPEANRGGAD